MNLREAAQQAIDALEKYQEKGAPFMECDAAVAAFRAALEPVTDCHEKEGEKLSPPFAWYDPSNGVVSTDKNDPRFTPLGQLWPLYRSADVGETSDHIRDATKMVDECAYPECLSTNGCEKQCPAFPRSKDDHIPDATKMMATSQESLQVEPVAWLIESYDIYAKRTLQRLVFDNQKNMQGVKITAYYTAPPERKPLTDAHLTALCRQHWDRQANILDHIAYARALERAHRIGGEE